jgi:hypothetical protein
VFASKLFTSSSESSQTNEIDRAHVVARVSL